MRFLFALVAIPLLASCYLFDSPPEVIQLGGKTMGTTYNITVVDAPADVTRDKLNMAVEAMLADVNGKMSNWDKTSEVSRFNALQSTAPVEISADFAYVMRAANDIHHLSGGKFDVTLAPLIDLWGFGAKKPGDPVPSDQEIDAALQNVGQAKLLTLNESTPSLQKNQVGVSVNLSAIAKGFGADQLAGVLRSHGVENYLVEIGGDLVTAGLNAQGEAWSIAIEKPQVGTQSIELIIPVSDLGMATSGDYRNFFEQDGIRYSHLIDPTTGRPITHRATSVTVLAQNAMLADALATALLVVGEKQGLEIAQANDIAAFFIWRGADGFESATTNAFETLTKTD